MVAEHLEYWGFVRIWTKNGRFFGSKSELETPETPETLETPETPETPETLLVMWAGGCVVGIVVAGELVAGKLVGRFFLRMR